MVLLARPAAASVPAHLAASTVQAAALVAAGAAAAEVASGPVAALAREGCPTMSTTFKVLAAGIAGIGLTLGGFGLVNLLDRPTAAASPAPAPVLANVPLPAFVAAEKGWVAAHTFTYKNPVTAVAFGPDIVVAGDKAGALVIWDAKTGKEKETILDGTAEGSGSIDHIQISPDGASLHLVTHDGDRFHLCSVEKMSRKFPGFGGNGNWRIYGTTTDGNHWFEAIGNKDLAMMPNTLGMNVFGGAADARFKHEDEIQYAAGASVDAVATVAGGVLRRWTKDKDKPVWEEKLEKFEPAALAVAPDGKTVALAGKGGEVRLYDAKTGKLTATLKGHTGAVVVVAFSPDNKQVATGGEDKTARVHDAATGKELAALKGHTGTVTAIAFSPGGDMLATGSEDKAVKVWEFKK